jgi:hypothetical protein
MPMIRIKYTILGWAIALSVFSTCSRDEDFTAIVVDPALQPYFESFVSEASKRGKILDLSKVNGLLADIEEAKVLGRCAQGAISGSTVTIDSEFWRKATNWEKEYVIFHELGHCALNRRHLEDQNADGTCVSMMQSGTNGCRMIYNAQTRSGYLDELFSP